MAYCSPAEAPRFVERLRPDRVFYHLRAADRGELEHTLQLIADGT